MLLHCGQGAQLDVFLVHHLASLLVREQLEGVADFQLAAMTATGPQIGKHALQLGCHLFHAGGRHDLHANGRRLGIDLDLPFVQLAFPQQLAQLLARIRSVGVVAAGQQGIKNTFFGRVLRPMTHLGNLSLTGHLHRHIGQVTDDGVHLAAHVAHLGELGRFNFDERGFRQPSETARNFCLAHAGGSDHQDVLGRNLALQGLTNLHPAPAVAQRYGHRTLGLVLADDVFVQFLDDFARCHGHCVATLLPGWPHPALR